MRTRSWLPVLTGAAAFLVTFVVGGVIGTDWLARNIEMDRLIIAIEQSESAMGEVQDRVSVVFDDLDGEVPSDAQRSDAETAAAVAKLAEIAVDGEQAIAAAAREIARVNVLPWHTDILQARDTYLLHNYAWQAYMQSAQKDPVAFTVPQNLVNQTFEDSEEPLMKAVPSPSLFDLPERVESIFEEGAPQVSGDVI
jgi:hypothetical protein